MKTKLFVIAIVGIVLTGLARSGEEAPAELSNTRAADVMLKIITDPQVVRLDDDLSNIRNYFSEGRVYGAGNRVLGGSDTDWFKGNEVLESPREIGGMQVAKIGLRIELSEQDKPAAREVAQAVIGGFRDYLDREHEQNRRVYAAKSDVYSRRVEEAEERLGRLIAEQNRLGDGLMDKNTVRQRLAEQEKARLDTGMQQAIVKRRAENLAKNIDQLRAEADRLEADRPVGGVPGVNPDEIRRLMEEQASSGGMRPLDREALERVNRGLESMRQAAGDRERQRQLADEIARLSREHRDALMELEELEIRKTVLFGWTPGNLSDSLKYEMIEVQIDAAKENLKRALVEREQFVTEMELIRPPMVIEEISAMPANQGVPVAEG